ncbi:amino acid adenylation domain-containing protein [Mycolicibacterium sp. 120266]|uniref:non-ribosomal peptide synthetase n=1 Tax=Mycolicibacterium sp. 120266 TaxID=3090601 RepID=UPI00299CDCF3|nr:amino acid adenylation domain-containing protein [Mycolicibacterium sp. 120266]MDX1873729.1 amino acid adenylation domain-containing protein [Mycolicibacterium sp. 120266]
MSVAVNASELAETIRHEIADLLGVAAVDIDPEVDLVSQGLDSIRMMSLAGKWRKKGLDIDFASLAAQPSVRAWSEMIGRDDAESDPEHDAEAFDIEADSSFDAPFPLAPMQHAMWIGRESDQQLGGVAGHLYVEFDGDAIDYDRLSAAATQLAERHPMLRVEFLPDGTQRIGPVPQPFPVQLVDLRHSDDVEARLAQLRRVKSHQQLEHGVLELALTLLPDGRSRLHVDLDMQAADAMSYRTLMSDLTRLYNGADLTPLGYTYRQYRLAAARRPRAADADRQWWAERIPELPDPPRLPVLPRAEQADPRHTTRRHHWLDPQTRDALFGAARRRGVTPAMALAASFSDALAGWSAEPRFLLNVPMFGREQHHPDVDALVGDFTSSLLLDIDLGAADTAAARSRAVQAAFRSAAAHAAYPGLSVLRDLSRHRGTQVLAPVVYTSALGLGELFAGEVTDTFGTPVWINSQGPQVLLDAQVTEFDGGILVNWDVREDAFPAGLIDAMFDRHIGELLRLAADDSAWEATRAPLIGAEQRAVRDRLNGITAEPGGQPLHAGFFASAAATPDATAVIGSTDTLSYAELREHVLAVAAALHTAGIKPGDTVAVLGPKGADQVTALLGILSAGAIYLPVGVDQPAERAERILATGGVRMALVCGDQEPTWLPALTIPEALRVGRRAMANDPGFAPVLADPQDLAYVLFTSGSTGEPKGVEVTHAAAMNTAEFLYGHFEIGPDDRCLALMTLECDLSVLDVFATLATGGAIVAVDEADRRNPDTWARLIHEHHVTVLNFLPGSLEMLVETATADLLSTLRVVLTGGDWVRTAMVRRLHTLAPGVRVAGLGGATETAIHATIHEAGTDLPAAWTAVPYGVPFPNNAARVVNSFGADCPDWVPGELWIGGRGIASGYRGMPELTATRFVEHDGRRWYRTGDLARYWPDGTLEFVGRADHRVKISGYRIELGDVEAALQRIPGVRAAVAGIVPVAGTRRTDALAALVSVDDPGLDVQQITESMTDLVPPHMIPRHLAVVERIPFTLAGKTDRRAAARILAELVADGPDDRRVPVTPVQRALAAIIGELLGTSDIGVDDDFFALGGDSVLATTAVARIREWLDTPTVMVPDIFATRTVEALAARLTAREAGSDRLDRVAELYLEVALMDDADVVHALDAATAS